MNLTTYEQKEAWQRTTGTTTAQLFKDKISAQEEVNKILN